MIKKGDFMKPNKKKKTNYEKFMKLFNRSIKVGEVRTIAVKDKIDDDCLWRYEFGDFPNSFKKFIRHSARLYIDFDSIEDFYNWKERIEE